MATTGKAFTAGGTIRRARFVKLSTAANNTVLEADANERIWGISQMGGRVAPIPSVTDDPPNAAITGEQVGVYFPGEMTLLEIGSGGCEAGDYLKSDGDGKGVALAETSGLKEEVGAIALETALEGALASVQVWRTTVTTETT